MKTLISQQLQHQVDKTIKKQKKTLSECYKEFANIFDKNTSERLPESKPWDHAIDLKPDFTPSNCKIYPLSPKETEEMNKFIDENLQKGYI